MAIVGFIGLIGFIIYVITTIFAYYDCDKKDMSRQEKEFWKNVLVKCFTSLSGTPVYWTAIKKPLNHRKKNFHKSIAQIKSDIAYYFFIGEVFAILSLLSLSIITAISSLIFAGLIDVPVILFKLAIFIFMPFPIIFYIFNLRMLYDFVQTNRDVADLKYYFGGKSSFFGGIKYYKKSRAYNE